MNLRFLQVALGAALSLALGLGPVFACCSISSDRTEAKIASQKVLVVWDPVTRMEHFVREAKFSGSGEDFGFLVPTPDVPEIVEAPSGIFSALEAASAPRIETRRRWTLNFKSVFSYGIVEMHLKSDAVESRSKGVEVLSRSIVAGFEVLVLQSTSAAVLTEWLRENKFILRDSVRDWLKPYIELKWKISAFRFIGETGKDPDEKKESDPERAERMMRMRMDVELGESEAVTKTIRMSFKTPRPLFPYRVPQDELSGARSSGAPATPLHLYFIGPERVLGQFGEAARPWTRELLFAGPLGNEVQGGLPAFCQLDKPVLTAFEDKSWPGGTEDLYFSRDLDQSPFQRVKIRWVEAEIPIPIELLLVLGAGLGGLAWYMKSKRSSAIK
jgi:hypothetical protein